MSLKEPKSYDEQIEILKNRGLIIKDEEKTKYILSNFNYYTFIGYLNQFKNDDGKYIENITFENAYKLYLFDRRFRNILLYAIEIIEISLKTKIAYISAHKIGGLGYLEKDNFKSKKEFDIFKRKFATMKSKNKKLPFLEHYNQNHNGKLPIWVAINIFSLGMIHNFYKNIAENKNSSSNNKMSIRKQVAKEYDTGDIQLESWIENIRYIRNIVAHYMRIYNFKIQKTPAKCKKNHKNNYIVSNRVFDIIYIMKFLILDEKEWNNILTNMEALFEEYEGIIDIDLLGFPNNWYEVLKK